MKANELRLGNYVLLNNNTRIYEVTAIAEVAIYIQKLHAKASTMVSTSLLEPIPITPELLERCGFVISGDVEWVIPLPNGNGCDLFLEHILADNTIPYDVVLRAEKHFIYLHSITYLHQLQNLYHALTGNELEVKM